MSTLSFAFCFFLRAKKCKSTKYIGKVYKKIIKQDNEYMFWKTLFFSVHKNMLKLEA